MTCKWMKPKVSWAFSSQKESMGGLLTGSVGDVMEVGAIC